MSTISVATQVMRPLSELEEKMLATVQLLATDVDGSLTTGGELSAAVLEAIGRLGQSGIEVLPVSGRPAGEVLGLCRYLPGVRRAIAENGLLEITPDRAPRWLQEQTDLARLIAVGDALNREFGAGLERCADAFCRLGDVAYERDERDIEALRSLEAEARRLGVYMVWSNVHIHLTSRPPDKGTGLERLLSESSIDASGVLTFGDAPNDAGMFVQGRFGISVGTKDVAEQPEQFMHLPAYFSSYREGRAFLELAERILQGR